MDVWLPVATLIIGLAAGMAGDYLRDRRQSSLALQSVKAARRDRYLDLKQTTVLELSEVLHDHSINVTRVAGVMDRPSPGADGEGGVDDVRAATFEADVVSTARIRALVTRVGDPELTECMYAMFDVTKRAYTEGSAFDVNAMLVPLDSMNARIGAILEDLANEA